MPRPDLNVRVECYAGHRGEETPRRFYFDDKPIEIAKVIDSWLAPAHRYFKVKSTDGAVYILRHDTIAHSWELILYDRGTTETATETDYRTISKQ